EQGPPGFDGGGEKIDAGIVFARAVDAGERHAAEPEGGDLDAACAELSFGKLLRHGCLRGCVAALLRRHRVKNSISAFAVASGASSHRKCPHSIAAPCTFVAHSRHTASGS